MEAKKQLEKLAKRIDKVLALELKKELKRSRSVSPIIKKFIETYSTMPTSGGKRIRGAFMYYSYLLCGGKDLDEILKTSVSIELIHAYLLVHDDIQDRGDLRRGIKTVHNVYKELYSEISNIKHDDGVHFGEAIGINAGDVLNHLGMNILVNSDFKPELKIRALSELNQHIVDVGYGQTLDIFGEILPDVDEKYVKQVQHMKTGLYTYELPLHLGAILSGKNGKYLDMLTKYAIPGGIAYQIQDDILGVFGSEEKTGKSVASDIVDGKKTLLTLKAYQKASNKDKVILDSTLGNKNATRDQLEQVKEIIIETGSLQYSIWLARLLLTRSSKAIETNMDKLKLNKEAAGFLLGINEYMYKREF